LAAQTKASAIPVLPEVGSTMVVLGPDLAGGLAGLDHRQTDAVLDAGQRVEELQLGEQFGLYAAARLPAFAVAPSRAADRVEHAVIDTPADIIVLSGIMCIGGHNSFPRCRMFYNTNVGDIAPRELFSQP